MSLDTLLARHLPPGAARVLGIVLRAVLIVLIAAYSDIDGGEFIYWNALNPTELPLVCPDCRLPLVPDSLAGGDALRCGGCATLVPVIAELVLFTERDIAGARLERRVDELTRTLADDTRYERYLETKLARGMIEPYAAFQPFNESVRVAEPLLEQALERLRDDDLVIDLWSRTGWTAHRLASACPEHRALALWDGDDGALGYAGQAYWFGVRRRPPNLITLLIEPGAALPVPDASIGIAHGHDVLHRRRAGAWLAGLERAMHDEATLLLPHVHLSDAEPDPYFERGGTYRSSEEYAAWFASRKPEGRRRVHVVSESFAFAAPQGFTLDQAAVAPGYNGFVIASPATSASLVRAERAGAGSPSGRARVVANPLVSVCPFTARVSPGHGPFGPHVEDLALRHPVYAERLTAALPERLPLDQLRLLAATARGETLQTAAGTLEQPLDAIIDGALTLQRAEIVRVASVSRAAVELQAAHANLSAALDIATAWRTLLDTTPATTSIRIEDQELDSDELRTLVDAWRHRLRSHPADEPIVLGTRATGADATVALAAWLEARDTLTSEQPGTVRVGTDTLLAPSLDTLDDYWASIEQYLDSPPLETQPACESLERTANRRRWLAGIDVADRQL